GYTKERRLERQMIADYEALLDEIAERLSPANHHTAVALASLPLEIRGFGHIKERNYTLAKSREATLLAELRSPSPTLLKAAEEIHPSSRKPRPPAEAVRDPVRQIAASPAPSFPRIRLGTLARLRLASLRPG